MNFLELCTEVANDIGLHGQLSSVAPSQPLLIDVVNSVRNAWIAIQKHRGLSKFMERRAYFTTTADVSTYTIDTLVPPTTSTFVGKINDIFYNDRRLTRIEPWNRTPSAEVVGSHPVWYREESDYGLTNLDTTVTFNLLGSEAYEIEIVYRSKVYSLTNATDIPMFPEDNHILIYHKAMTTMASQLERVGLLDTHMQEYDNQMGYLLRTTNPKKNMRQGKRFI